MTEENKDTTPTDVEILKMLAENKELKSTLDEITAKFKDEREAHRKASTILEIKQKADEVDKLRKRGCTYGIEILDSMTVNDLRELNRHYDYFNPPVTFKSSADMGGTDSKNSYDGLYDVYVPMEQRKNKLVEL